MLTPENGCGAARGAARENHPSIRLIHKRASVKKQSTLAELTRRYPKAFLSENPCPLAIGIKQIIIEHAPDLEARAVHYALAAHCGTVAYLRSLLSASHRVDLYGNPVEAIAYSDRERAGRRLVQLRQGRSVRAERRAKKFENLERKRRAAARGRTILKLKA